jgi:ATP-dependent Zn protease
MALISKKTLLVWAVLILLVIAIYNMFAPEPRKDGEYLALGQVMASIREQPRQVKWLRITGEHWRGMWANGQRFRTTAPKLDGALVDQLNGIAFEVRAEEDSWETLLVGSWLPMIVLVVVFFLFMRRLQEQTKKAAPSMIDLFKRIAELEAEVERLSRGDA